MTGPQPPGFDSLTLHAGQSADAPFRAHTVPTHLAAGFVFPDAVPDNLRAFMPDGPAAVDERHR
jgi:O-acetylhomoserine/O-acetylserine sulfhydrylase-like pyridoxal-dependent enzyme